MKAGRGCNGAERAPMEEKGSNGPHKHSRHAQQRHTGETASGAKTAGALRAAPVSSAVMLLSVVVSTPGVFDR
jgi:hypothetical protein